MNVENNKIIAEFMGKEYKDNTIVIYYNEFSGMNPSGKVWQECKYHTDWNWLMTVLEKIKNIPNKEVYGMLRYEFDVILDVPHAQIVQSYKLYFGDKTDKYFDVIKYEGTFIENTFNACVEFIKFYNLNSVS